MDSILAIRIIEIARAGFVAESDEFLSDSDDFLFLATMKLPCSIADAVILGVIKSSFLNIFNARLRLGVTAERIDRDIGIEIVTEVDDFAVLPARIDRSERID
jgi:hypothetical protein